VKTCYKGSKSLERGLSLAAFHQSFALQRDIRSATLDMLSVFAPPFYESASYELYPNSKPTISDFYDISIKIHDMSISLVNVKKAAGLFN
jgi:hypothetical protein